jgi:hypothetical protein
MRDQLAFQDLHTLDAMAATANRIFGTPPKGAGFRLCLCCLVFTQFPVIWSWQMLLLAQLPLGGLGVTVMAGKAKMASASPVSTLGIVPRAAGPL